jgi:hypothetical protein
MPWHRQGSSTPRESASGDPQGGVPSPPDALPDACDAQASPRIGRLSGRTWDAVVWVAYVRFYPLASPRQHDTTPRVAMTRHREMRQGDLTAYSRHL